MEKILNITPKYGGYKDFPKDSEGKILLPRNKDGVIVIERKNTVSYGNGLLGLVDGSAIATSEWEQLRNCFVLLDDDGAEHFHWCVGGSSSGTCLGLSPFETMNDLYQEKITGQSKKIDDELEYTFSYGHCNEELIAIGFQSLTKMKVVKDDSVFFNESTGFMQANVDYFVMNVDGSVSILEVKTANGDNIQQISNYKSGDVPSNYYSQAVLHYPKVLGDVFNLTGTYFAIGYNNKLKDIIICHFDRDKEQETTLYEAEKGFVECLYKKEPPKEVSVNPENTIKRLKEQYPTAKANSCELSDKGKEAVNCYLSINSQLNSLTKEEEQLKQDLNYYKSIIIEEMAENECSSDVPVGNQLYYVNYKNTSRTNIDKTVLKNKYPDVYKDVASSSSFRKFSILKSKKG